MHMSDFSFVVSRPEECCTDSLRRRLRDGSRNPIAAPMKAAASHATTRRQASGAYLVMENEFADVHYSIRRRRRCSFSLGRISRSSKLKLLRAWMSRVDENPSDIRGRPACSGYPFVSDSSLHVQCPHPRACVCP